MVSVNVVVLAGRLSDAPELKTMPSGDQVARFRLSIPDALDALDHQFDIDVRRRGSRPEHVHVGKVDADRVAGEDGAGRRIH